METYAQYQANERYFLRIGTDPWKLVTKEEWVKAESCVGFHGGRPGEPSTAGFSSYGSGREIQGSIFNIGHVEHLSAYDSFNQEFANAVRAMLDAEGISHE